MRSSQGQIEDVCKISQSKSKKRLEYLPGNTFWVINVNQPVYIYWRLIAFAWPLEQISCNVALTFGTTRVEMAHEKVYDDDDKYR